MAAIDKSSEQQALAWLARRHAGAWSAADERALADWLAADPAHSIAWLNANGLWRQLAELRELAAPELHAARQPRNKPRLRWRAGFAVAALATIALVLLPSLLPGSLMRPQIEQTARGEIRTLTLADGSSVILDASSRLEVDYGLRCRCLRLHSGAAIFTAAHDDPRPFVVDAEPGRIRDIGTEFLVRHSAAENLVAVLSGEIELAARPGSQPERLQAGERRAYDGSGKALASTAAPATDLAAWRDGQLVFHDTPLPAVLAEFARYHEFDVAIDSRLKNYNLSGRFASTDLEGLLDLLQAAYPLSVQRPSPTRLRLLLKTAAR